MHIDLENCRLIQTATHLFNIRFATQLFNIMACVAGPTNEVQLGFKGLHGCVTIFRHFRHYIAISQNFFPSLPRPLQLRGSLQIISHSATFRELNTSFQDPVLDCCMPFGVVMFGQVCYLECKSRFLLKSYDRY